MAGRPVTASFANWSSTWFGLIRADRRHTSSGQFTVARSPPPQVPGKRSGCGQPWQSCFSEGPPFGSERTDDLNASSSHTGAKPISVDMDELRGPEILAGPFCVRQIDRGRPSAIAGRRVPSQSCRPNLWAALRTLRLVGFQATRDVVDRWCRIDRALIDFRAHPIHTKSAPL